MLEMHEFLRTAPFDLYELNLFQLVAKHRSFTRAAEVAGLTQSAITRQIKGMEESLGMELLTRTTRRVTVTEAGAFLEREAVRLIGDVEHSLERLKQDYGGARKVVRVGVSRTIGFAYLPGFFHANVRRAPAVGCRVTYSSSAELLAKIEAHEIDLAVLCPPRRLPQGLRITHRFADAFTFIAPSETAAAFATVRAKEQGRWLAAQNWLMLEGASNTGQRLRAWLKQQGWAIEPAMELDSFDLIVNLVALGLGCSFVPTRTLALYGRKRGLSRVSLPKRFSRELVVVMRRHRTVPTHLATFVDNVLF
jgi:DNA-binding transcriptional LysR family regulator